MGRLYCSADHQQHWIAYTPEEGYVIFPAEENGWIKKHPFHGFDPLRMREVPTWLAFKTGFPAGSSKERRSTAA